MTSAELESALRERKPSPQSVPVASLAPPRPAGALEAVRAVLAAHPSLAKPLSASTLRPRLPPQFRHLTDGALRYYMRRVWKEFDETSKNEPHSGIAA
jgi:hypothetical protein